MTLSPSFEAAGSAVLAYEVRHQGRLPHPPQARGSLTIPPARYCKEHRCKDHARSWRWVLTPYEVKATLGLPPALLRPLLRRVATSLKQPVIVASKSTLGVNT